MRQTLSRRHSVAFVHSPHPFLWLRVGDCDSTDTENRDQPQDSFVHAIRFSTQWRCHKPKLMKVTFLVKWKRPGASIRLQGVVDLLASREMRSAQWRERE